MEGSPVQVPAPCAQPSSESSLLSSTVTVTPRVPTFNRAPHAQVSAGYALVSIARSRLIHARYRTNVIILPLEIPKSRASESSATRTRTPTTAAADQVHPNRDTFASAAALKSTLPAGPMNATALLHWNQLGHLTLQEWHPTPGGLGLVTESAGLLLNFEH
jgi:hypothetical protein